MVLQSGRNTGFSRADHEAVRGAFGKRVVIVAAKSGNRDAFNGFSVPGSDAGFVNTNGNAGFVQVARHELSTPRTRRTENHAETRTGGQNMKRNLFAELSEGFDALAEARQGKRTLRIVEAEAAPVGDVTPHDITPDTVDRLASV
jgi:hypothetical protein